MHIDAHRSKGCMTHIINTYQSTSLRYCVHTHLSSLSTWRSYSNGSWRLPTTAWGCWKRWLIPWTQLPPATSQPGMRGAAVAAMMNVEFQWSESCHFNHIRFLIDIVLPLHHYFIYLQPIYPQDICKLIQHMTLHPRLRPRDCPPPLVLHPLVYKAH